jgi:hypothetical protein
MLTHTQGDEDEDGGNYDDDMKLAKLVQNKAVYAVNLSLLCISPLISLPPDISPSDTSP